MENVVKTTTQRSRTMNDVLFAIEIPKTFEVGVLIGAIIGFIMGGIACATSTLD